MILAAAIACSINLVAPAADAVERIAREDVVTLGHVSYDGHVGDTSIELARITKLGDHALPALLQMAASTSPVARVAAAAGLRDRAEPAAQEAFARLLSDQTRVRVQYGCMVESTTVADATALIAKFGVI